MSSFHFHLATKRLLKKRPAVVISSDIYNNRSLDIIIMAVTSNLKNSVMANECEIKDYSSAGLLKPSIIKSAISTIDKSLVLKRLGNLSPEDLNSLNKILRELLAL